ncbi:alpha/beta hydrolase [Microbacterium trichothecenolyticum]|uniref:alpha/beta fold hydrolase n=1 Tax=Microbacterium trichothecenolyticum TaxID=69370 RepID=UPI001C6F09FC|nr:alpha/beta hydrolase [Microbacterium trichothecenolyticum]MBW9121447.1 alpha/beta hydrolase [Microbacterium trichothecenolyticum]
MLAVNDRSCGPRRTGSGSPVRLASETLRRLTVDTLAAMGHAHPAPGIAIEYFTAGVGRPLVLVHGITESRRAWDPLLAPLIDAGYRVTAVDLRGHGASSVVAPYDLATMAGDLSAVLADIGADDALLVGHSLGGAVATAYAASGPCRGVVNVDQPLLLSGFQETLRSLEPQLRGSTAEFDGAISAIFEALAGPLDGAERRRIDDLRDGRQDVVLGAWEAVFASSPADLDAMVEGVISTVTAPYLSLHGIDPGAEYGEWLTEHVPSATFEVWPDLGHYPHLIRPADFVARVVAFDAPLG